MLFPSAEKAELKVNGKSLGFGQKSDGFLFTFKNVAWKAGNISAIGYDEKGKQVSAAQINTVGEPVALRLTNIKRPIDFLADGHDVSMVEVEVIDAKGNRCPTALNMINFSLEGPAEWKGGMAMGKDNYILAKNLPVENGVNRILIRSTTIAGTITIKANADGLKGSQYRFNYKTIYSRKWFNNSIAFGRITISIATRPNTFNAILQSITCFSWHCKSNSRSKCRQCFCQL